jgi:hypothetical protein
MNGLSLSGGPVGLGPTACKALAAVLNYVNPVDLSGMGFDDGPLVAAVQLARSGSPSSRPVRSSMNLSATIYGVVACLRCVRERCSGPVATTIVTAVMTLSAT